MRTGAEYRASLDDGRRVVFDGEVVSDVAHHPAFAGVVETIATMYDVAADPASGMQTADPETGRPANRIWLAPRTPDDLRLRRAAHETWARVSHGWTGRSPDHVGSFLAAFSAHPETFAAGVRDCSDAVRAYTRRLIDEDLYLAYAIIPPKVQTVPGSDPEDKVFVQVGVVDEREDGIVVRGSQFLATGAAIADEIFVSCIQPLKEGAEDFALSFALPAAAAGLTMYHRRPLAPQAASGFDQPLTSRFDEPDAVLVFDDVFIPWERVFAYRDLETVRAQFFATGAHRLGNWQAQIRFLTKLRFIASVARRITKVSGADKDPGVRGKLGELASLVSIVDSAVTAAEATAEPDAAGMLVPGKRALYGVMGLQSELYPRVMSILRELAGSNVTQPPATIADLEHPQSGPDLLRYIVSPGADTVERVRLYKLAWDMIGTEFAGRHQQYETFYAGAPAMVRSVYTLGNFGYDDLDPDLDAFLATIPLPSTPTETSPAVPATAITEETPA
ncbi:4-hydroxyphenylacetate 3-monooxygenase oxygenase component [Pseudoclavibacter endophyticus]|uniref:4-hydroxyphenylacetate 3-hydroxylase n=1 Tax=Pseudoclavibacter endophyticus TaxID=1778590 RepID=A0A6H9WNR2_9MICO|nr:4-hydroxyphenylacetate 3-hydroxylase N-terminal domain-containing protein [Pseudoclavibacter endophyticus]KAB1649738.1 4-hydroxyphenylacetate 3-hydroxylase [Pseudoclavibacter endophyticus]GGA60130.1 4-hydroxyphenylacetate 3-monooxygenase oxygenase component [Pseudoclavibacter endophyticus]